MFNPKVLDAFQGTEKRSSDILRDVDALTGDFLGWAGELKEALEREYAGNEDTTSLLLPKTPSEKRHRHKRARKASASKLEATVSENVASNLDDTISPRARDAKRAAKCKISQIVESTANLSLKSITEGTETEKNKDDESNATYVLPKASTKTKSVSKIKPSESAVAESQSDENQVAENETLELINDSEKTPVVAGDEPFRLPRTSTSAMDIEKTPVVHGQDHEDMEMDGDVISSTRIISAESNGDGTVSVDADNVSHELSKNAQADKKKGKAKKDEEAKESVDEMATTMRITRTKSKALKKMMEEKETKQTDITAFAKKLVIKAKNTSLRKSQLDALKECISPTGTNAPGHSGSNLPFGTHLSSKYHLLVSASKKLPAVPTNSALKIAKASGNKDRTKAKVPSRDGSVESLVRTATKPPKDDLEKESKLRSKKEKEEEAVSKRQNAIKAKIEELKRKNELKHQMAMKQREKLEQEKYHNMIQLEKEKEERHKLILQERQNKLKEEVFKKKMLTQQKIAETMERRRMEEEARLAKLKEMEAEEQRLALEKQKEQEWQEKRAQERLAEKKARKEYEQQLKQELEAERLRAEKLLTAKKCLPSTSKLHSASKRPGFLAGLTAGKKEWDYKPRHENDYGLEDEDSELDSDDEKPYHKSKPPTPWAKEILSGKAPVVEAVTLDMLCEYMQCQKKTPDIHKMFGMTPTKRIKRSSSAIWNTPSS